MVGCAGPDQVANPLLRPWRAEAPPIYHVGPMVTSGAALMEPPALARLDALFREALSARPGVQLREGLPEAGAIAKDAAGGHILRGAITGFTRREETRPDLRFRVIEMQARLDVLAADMPTAPSAPPRQAVNTGSAPIGGPAAGQATAGPPASPVGPQYTLRLAYTLQIALPGEGALRAPDADMELALREMAEALAQALLPGAGENPALPLRRAMLAPTEGDGEGEDVTTWVLNRGNVMAARNRWSDAVQMWRTVLFAPGAPPEEGDPVRYQITPRVLEALRGDDPPRDEVTALATLQHRPPLELAPFLALVRPVLGGSAEMEGRVLELAPLWLEGAAQNSAAAHHNLARAYRLQRRMDLAVWHMGRAWLYNPSGEILQTWETWQGERGLSGGGLPTRRWLRLGLQLPPPVGVAAMPGWLGAQALGLPGMKPPPEDTKPQAGGQDSTPRETPPVREGPPAQ